MTTMKCVRALGLSVVLAGLASVPVLAFQEQQGGQPAAPAMAGGPATPSQGTQDPSAEFSGTASREADRGTEVSIPGLGKLGVLPKMDFGLELLYGANESQDNKLQNDPGPETDDLRIRGQVKHRF